jgi:hypothetical protein
MNFMQWRDDQTNVALICHGGPRCVEKHCMAIVALLFYFLERGSRKYKENEILLLRENKR